MKEQLSVVNGQLSEAEEGTREAGRVPIDGRRIVGHGGKGPTHPGGADTWMRGVRRRRALGRGRRSGQKNNEKQAG